MAGSTDAPTEPEAPHTINSPVKKAPPPEKAPMVSIKEETESLTSISPPDGGWGWMVVFASFMIHIVADGITYSFGIFLVALIDEFDADRSTVSLIPSILVGITLGSGPIASSLVNKYGCRPVTIAGTLIAAAGLALSMFANSISLLFFSVGICTGFGFGLIYLPAIVSVSMYFEKKRAFATGIAVCGSGLGTFIMAPVTKWLITQFGWKYAILITACLVLTCIAFGCLMRPLENTTSKKDDTGSDEETKALTLTNGDMSNLIEHGEKLDSQLPSSPPEIQVNGSVVPCNRPFAQQMGMGGKYNDMERMAMSHPAFLDQAERPQVVFGSHSQFQDIKKRQLSPAVSEVMSRKDIFYSGSLYNIPEFKDNPSTYRRSMRKIAGEAKTDETEKQAKLCCVNISPKNAGVFNQMVDFSLFKDPVFLMYVVSNFLTSIGFNVPYVYTVDRARGWDIEEGDAAFLLSIIGIANTIGRLVLGWLSDHGKINRLYLYNTCLMLCGISMALSTLMTTYTSQAVYCATFGVTSGAYVGLTSVVLVDLLGLDKLTNAFGLLLMFQGIASVLGPPFIGFLFDQLGNYDAGFYFSGAVIFLSGAMLFAIPPLQRRLEKKKPTFNITSGKGEDDFVSDA